MNSNHRLKTIAVIGLGNPLRSDEGIGILLVNELSKRARLFSQMEFFDLGTSGMSALHAMAMREAVVFVDCAMMGMAPGTIRKFTPDAIHLKRGMPRFSTHEGDLLQIISLSRQMQECPLNVIIFGIQPATIDPGEKLSSQLQAAFSRYLQVVADELIMLKEQ